MKKKFGKFFLIISLLFFLLGNNTFAATYYFNDDFNGTERPTTESPRIWERNSNNRSSKSSGLITTVQARTNQPSRLRSYPLTLGSDKVVFEWRIKAYGSNSYVYPYFGILAPTSNKWILLTRPANYQRIVNWYGMYLRYNNTSAREVFRENPWNHWYTVKLKYDLSTGQGEYTIDNGNGSTVTQSYIGPIVTDRKITIQISPVGWRTTHYIRSDYLRIYKDGANCNENGTTKFDSSNSLQENYYCKNSDIVIGNNSVLTVPNGKTLILDTTNNSITAENGSKIDVENGGNLLTGNIQQMVVDTNAKSCKDLHSKMPALPSGVYDIKPDSTKPAISTYCDMSYDGGGWTRYYANEANTSDTDLENCFNGTVIDNTTLKCFNPNQFGMKASQILIEDSNGNHWTFNNPTPDASTTTNTVNGSNYRYCQGNANYFTKMRNSSNSAHYYRPGLSYCKYDRAVAGKQKGSSNYQNYSTNGTYGPNPGGRESSAKKFKLYIRE